MLLQLRAADAPEQALLDFTLPSGAELRLKHETGAGGPPSDRAGAEVVRDGEVLARIAPPAAWDAGGETVPVSYALADDRLTIRIPHRGGDWEYPLLVDPYIQENYLWHQSGSDSGRWGYGETRGEFEPFDCSNNPWCGMPVSSGRGMYVKAPGWVAYDWGSHAEWFWQAPPNTNIVRVDWNYAHAVGNQDCAYGYIQGPNGAQGTPAFCTDYNSSNSWQTSCTAHPSCDTNGSTPGNWAIFGLWMFNGTINDAWAHLKNAYIAIWEGHRPTWSGVSGERTGEWFHPAEGDHEFSAWASDVGLGVKQVRFRRPSKAHGEVIASAPPSNCDGSRWAPCPLGPVGYTWAYPYSDLPEGINTLGLLAEDIVGNPSSGDPGAGTYDARRWQVKVDRTPPSLTLAGSLWTQRSQGGSHLDVSNGQDLYTLNISARDGAPDGLPADRRSGVKDVAIYIDGVEEDRFTTDASCVDSCPLDQEFVFDADWVTEGTHTIKVVARDRLDQPTERTFTIRVVRENHYAAALDAWRQDTERRVDDAVPVIGLTRPMPPPPDDWRRGEGCESAETALRACYDRAAAWGTDVRRWLTENLPAGIGASELPDPPTFDYSYAEDTTRELTRRIRDEFALGKRGLTDATATLDVAITFHQPLDPAQFAAAVPLVLPQEQSALAGVYDPGGADWQGQVRIPIASTLSASVEDFYVEQSQTAAETIAQIQSEAPDDAEDAEDLAAALADASAFKTHLDARGAFITGVAVRVDPIALRTILTDPTGVIKAVKLLPATASVAEAGADALGTGPGPDAATVRHAQSITDDGGTAGASAFSAVEAPEMITAAAAPREPTCVQRGQRGFLKRALQDPHPHYWAPSRHKADTFLGKEDGDHHQKRHVLVFRWKANGGLAFTCSDRPGDRNVEIEARVFPEFPEADEDHRWSDNWESNRARKYTSTNMPGNIHQDDLASGEGAWPYDKQYYPDFSIVAQSSQAFRYRKLYHSKFTTNEGQTDDSQEVVIYSGQATTRARDKPDTVFDEAGYCGSRNEDYKSCMFSRVTTCWNHATLGAPPKYRKYDWWDDGMSIPPLHPSVSRWPESAPSQGNEIIKFCDPKPTGADRD